MEASGVMNTRCRVQLINQDWVAGAGLNEVKEAPGFRVNALQPQAREKNSLDESSIPDF